MTFRVNLSPSAIADVESAYLWYKEKNRQFANAWFNDLAQAITSYQVRVNSYK